MRHEHPYLSSYPNYEFEKENGSNNVILKSVILKIYEDDGNDDAILDAGTMYIGILKKNLKSLGNPQLGGTAAWVALDFF